MKKTIVLSGIILGIVGYYLIKYNNEMYRGEIAYALVPTTIPQKKEAVDINGEPLGGYSYDYNFTFIKEDGTKYIMNHELSGPNPSPFVPNTYVKAEISKKRIVNGPYKVSTQDIPRKIKEKLNK